MEWVVEVAPRESLPDPRGEAVRELLREAGLEGVQAVRVARGYLLGGISEAQARRAAAAILADAITEEVRLAPLPGPPPAWREGELRAAVFRRPGVMDPAADSVRRALATIGCAPGTIATYEVLRIRGAVAEEPARRALDRTLANPLIHEVRLGATPPPPVRPPASHAPRVDRVPLVSRGDEVLASILEAGGLSLTRGELETIRTFFRGEGRDPTDLELETIAQTWSEHCKHKTFTSPIELEDRRIENLFRETIQEATRRLEAPWCLSVFRDNAGIVAFDESWGLAFKVETHNHPSALEPYGGAATGVGGVIRDVLGCGLGAHPILATDVFCFAPPDLPEGEVPPGVLPPRRILRGVLQGVRDYGNRMGIPTASGGFYFDPRYVANPLVFVGCLGILPRDRIEKEPRVGDRIFVVGGRTGRDGIHGATFSSAELDDDSAARDAGAVQIGHAVEERRVLDALLRARDLGLYRAITDCGAGGLSSAVGEMGSGLGASVELARVPLKYPGLSPAEIWISEAQERMVVAVPPEHAAAFEALLRGEDVEATDLGTFTGDGRLTVTFEGESAASLPMSFLHEGLPREPRRATVSPPATNDAAPPEEEDANRLLLRLLAHPTIASKEGVIRQYDHEVQGMMALRPLVGPRGHGPGDAVVLTPRRESLRAVAVSCGLQPGTADADPYASAALAIDEAVRNVVAAGADPDRIAILDNFCLASPNRPEVLGDLVRMAEACRDVALGFGTPFISGKDSFFNEFTAGGREIRIPPTLLVSALGLLEDVRRAVSSDLEEAGNVLAVVGRTGPELGGSQVLHLLGRPRARVPQVAVAPARKIFAAVHRAIRTGAVRSCHDLSEGGLAVALAEMALGGDLGATVSLQALPRKAAGIPDATLLFAETPSRFLLEVAAPRWAEVARTLEGVPAHPMGEVTTTGRVRVLGEQGRVLVDQPLDAIRDAFLAGAPLPVASAPCAGPSGGEAARISPNGRTRRGETR